MVRQLADRLGIELGVVETYCRRLPPDERGLRRSEVVGGRLILAANIVSMSGDSAVVDVIGYQGGGHHSAGSNRLLLRHTGNEWVMADRLLSSFGVCVPGG